METNGLGTRPAQTPHFTSLCIQPVKAHLLALELKKAALLAIIPAATVEREITLASIQVLVLWHQGNHRLAGQVRELPIPEPKANGDEEKVHPSEPQQQLALIFGDYH